jgi:amino acid transporter
MVDKEKKKETPHGRNAFGTFGGVFTPSILTILGVIMFLRADFVIGEAGILGAMLILGLSEFIVILTALSLSAIGTNTHVRGGGAYYLISRVMGPEFGGSIGLALFLAMALSVPFYILGFTEALIATAPALAPHFRAIAISVAVLLFGLNYVGARWAIKAQYLVMTVLALSIISFLGGAWVKFDPALFAANWKPGYTSPEYGFWSLFAIYFPAVTGIMAGVNMSGDLRDPSRSLVRGTFAAVGVGSLIYLAQIVLCGGSQSRADLIQRPYEALMLNALVGTTFLVAAGVFAATLSSAVGSYMGAPRILQALARDRIFRVLRPLAVGTRKGDEPRRALWFTMALALVVLWFASGQGARDAFNTVATLVTMLFLCTYGMVNVAAFVESFGLNPSFRPQFRLFHWSTALLGAAGCVVAMLFIDPWAALLAVAIIVALYIRISRWVVKVAFGDARRGFVYSALAKNLLALRDLASHPKNWRPSILVMSGDPENRLALVQYSVWFEAGRGIVTVTQMLAGDLSAMAERRAEALKRLDEFIRTNDLDVFPEVVVAPDFDAGVRVVLQAQSIGPIKPNIVMMGWPSDPERFQPMVRHIQDIRLLGKSCLVCVDRGLPVPGRPLVLDLWWRGRENGSLMLILAHLLRLNPEWSRTTIRVLRVLPTEAERAGGLEALTKLAQAARIQAQAEVVISEEPFEMILHRYSAKSDLVLLGFQPPEEDEAQAFRDRFNKMLEGLPTTILVSSSGEADLFA